MFSVPLLLAALLGSENFRTRERAQADLQDWVNATDQVALVEPLTRSADPEVRLRAGEVVEAYYRVIPEGVNVLHMPGWCDRELWLEKVREALLYCGYASLDEDRAQAGAWAYAEALMRRGVPRRALLLEVRLARVRLALEQTHGRVSEACREHPYGLRGLYLGTLRDALPRSWDYVPWGELYPPSYPARP